MIDEEKTEKSKIKIKLFLTRLISWKVFLIIFLPALFLDSTRVIGSAGFMEILLKTIFIVIFYHLLRTLPSILFSNTNNKYVKIFIKFLSAIALFFVVISFVIVFVGIPLYEGVQQNEEEFSKMYQSEQQDKLLVISSNTQKDETEYQKKDTNPYVQILEREGKTSSNDVISLAWNQCGGQLWKVQISITPIDSYRVIITKYACTKGGEYIDGQFYEDGKPSTPWKGLEGYSFAGQIIDSNDNIVEDFIGGRDVLSVVDTPEGFPLLTLLSTAYGATNTWHTYHLYSTSPVFKKIAEITQPLNKYQVTNGKGSERIVDGFYQDSDGNFLIDRLTTEGTELGKSNASQEWRLETLKLVDGNMVSMGIRDFPENYKRLD